MEISEHSHSFFMTITHVSLPLSRQNTEPKNKQQRQAEEKFFFSSGRAVKVSNVFIKIKMLVKLFQRAAALLRCSCFTRFHASQCQLCVVAVNSTQCLKSLWICINFHVSLVTSTHLTWHTVWKMIQASREIIIFYSQSRVPSTWCFVCLSSELSALQSMNTLDMGIVGMSWNMVMRLGFSATPSSLADTV